MNLAQRGFQAQFGYNWKRWAAIGFDTSYFGGGSSLTVPQLNNATIAKLAPVLAHYPGFVLWTPYTANTFTITGGPQLNYRHFKYVTLFIHPDIGAMYQSVTAQPPNPLMTQVVKGLLGPSMKYQSVDCVLRCWRRIRLERFQACGTSVPVGLGLHAVIHRLAEKSAVHLAYVRIADVPLRKERAEVKNASSSAVSLRGRSPTTVIRRLWGFFALPRETNSARRVSAEACSLPQDGSAHCQKEQQDRRKQADRSPIQRKIRYPA